MKTLLLTSLSLILAVFLFFSLTKQPETARVLPEIPKLGKDNQYPSDWLYRQRSWPSGQINPDAVRKARSQANRLNIQAKHKNAVSWQQATGRPIPGRINALAMPGDGNLYAGASTGGLFVSRDDGQSWQGLFEDQPSLSIGAIGYSPANPQILYVGTGEANGSYNSVWYGGTGVYKTTDGGATWLPVGLNQSPYIGRIAVHPNDPNIVFAAALGQHQFEDEHRGIYRSTNGGHTWEKVLFFDNKSGGIDVIINPSNPNLIYAATWNRIRAKWSRDYTGEGSRLWRSRDGGDTWETLSNGLPESDETVGRWSITLAPSDPSILYAAYSKEDHAIGGLFRSDDAGDSWTSIDVNPISDVYASFGWFFGNLTVHPDNPDHLFVPGVQLYITEDAGQSWVNYYDTVPDNLQNNPDFQMHVDHHALVFHPDNSDRVVIGNDGGVYFSDGEQLLFEERANPPTSQIYACSIDPNNPDILLAGLQDNGTNVGFRDSDNRWTPILGGDGFRTQVEPGNSNSIYAEAQFGNLFHIGDAYTNLRRLAPNDERFGWNTPMKLDPNDPLIFYAGGNRLWRYTNRTAEQPRLFDAEAVSPDLTNTPEPGSGSGSAVITAFDIAPSDSQVIYAGTDDSNVWVTQDGGSNWEPIKEGLPERWVTALAVDPENAGTAYITYSGYYDLDYQAHVLRTDDFGQTWTDISANLPEAPVNDIIIDPANTNQLFVATEFGVYYNPGDGIWRQLGIDLPLVTVLDLDLHPETRRLAAATYGRSLFIFDLNQLDSAPELRGSQQPYLSAVSNLSSDGFEVDIHMLNTNLNQARLELYPFDKNGVQLRGGAHVIRLDPRNKTVVNINELFGPETDWVQIGSNEEVLIFSRMTSEGNDAASWATQNGSDQLYIPHVARDTSQFETKLATVNISPNSSHALLRANNTGIAIEDPPLRQPYASQLNDVRHYFGTNLDSVNFGTLSNANLLGAMEYFRFNQKDRTAALALNGDSGTVLNFLHIASDNTLFWTGLVYFNAGDEVANIQRIAYSASGQEISNVQHTLEAGEKLTLLRDHNGSSGIPEGSAWMQIRGNQPLVGYELFGSSTLRDDRFFAGLQGNYEAEETINYPFFQADQDTWTGYIAVNLGEQAADIKFTLYDQEGNAIQNRTIENVAPGRKITILAEDFFFEELIPMGSWVRATGPDSEWAGFMLWGDHNVTVRNRMSGLTAR